ncbi:sirohydrochlorin chelatase [Alkalithermobacter paradoxus]|uniref:Sirohydrochlorin ferrochelatase n=1 Tax=Alkalithermobacter paradoxus TaxID=29349 RepID=A0A1V4I7L5_9FIRM|nr:sirohydrochlorin ferrochelatase [[Clostridium] thermoalcaliphilum]
MKGLIILAHGSKINEVKEVLLRIIDEVKSKVSYDLVEGAYLQFIDPSLEACIHRLYKKGCTDITIFPLFLFNGSHIRNCIPNEIDSIQRKYIGLKIRFLESIGYDPNLIEIIIRRVQ